MRNPRHAVAAASRATPSEACGVTMDGVAVPLINVSQHPERTFRVNTDELRTVIEHHSPAVWDGVWHSHPNGIVEPSDDDIQWHPKGKALYIVAQGKVFEYTDEGDFVKVHDG